MQKTKKDFCLNSNLCVILQFNHFKQQKFDVLCLAHNAFGVWFSSHRLMMMMTKMQHFTAVM